MALLFSAPAGFFREVRVKSPAAMRLRALIGGRSQLVGISTGLSNHMRGIMKTFGLVVPNGGGRVFETNVRTLLSGQEALASMVLPLLETGAARCARRLPGSTTNSSRWRGRAPPAG
jgi:transposase